MTQEPEKPTGKEILDFRKRKGLSQQDLATMLGVALPTVKRWENEKNTPRDRHLVALASILGGAAAASASVAASATVPASAFSAIARSLGPSFALGPYGPLLMGIAAVAGVGLSVFASKSKQVSPDSPSQEQVDQQLWELREQMIRQLPIPRTTEQREKAEKVRLAVEVDRILFDRFEEEANLRGFTPSRLLESLLWLFLGMPGLSFQEPTATPNDLSPEEHRSGNTENGEQ